MIILGAVAGLVVYSWIGWWRGPRKIVGFAGFNVVDANVVVLDVVDQNLA